MEHILEKYNRKMQDYYEQVVPHLFPMIETNSIPFQDNFKRLFDFYIFTSYLVDDKLFPKTLKELDTLKVLYSRASLSLFSIFQLLSSGLIEDASVVLRSLLETRVTLKVLLERDTLERLKLYREYYYVARWEKLNRDKDFLKNGKLSSEHFSRTYDGIDISEIEKKFEEVRGNYHPKTPYHWAWKIYKDDRKTKNPSFKFICEKLGLGDDYEYMYSSLSIFVHSESTSEVMLTRENTITVAPRFTGPVKLIGYFAVSYMVDIVHGILDYFKPDDYEGIKIYCDVYRDNFRDNLE